MGTRADFYIGQGPDAEWVGSIAWDGYPSGIDNEVLEAKSLDDYRNALKKFLTFRDDFTSPEYGWPWPWDTSRTTDYAYSFFDNSVFCSCFGSNWYSPKEEKDEEFLDIKGAVFPNMKKLKNVQLSGSKSGLIVIE